MNELLGLVSVLALAKVLEFIVAVVVLPLMALYATWNMNRIRLNLERLNQTLEGGRINARLTLEQPGGALTAVPPIRAGAGPLKL